MFKSTICRRLLRVPFTRHLENNAMLKKRITKQWPRNGNLPLISQTADMCRRVCGTILIILLCIPKILCHEKTLRKIVRNQSKMEQRPFSGPSNADVVWRNTSLPQQYPIKDKEIIFPGFGHDSKQMKTFHRMHRPKVSKIHSALETSKSKSTYSRKKMSNNDNVANELRQARNTFFPNNSSTMDMYAPSYADNFLHIDKQETKHNKSNNGATSGVDHHQMSKFFPSAGDQELQSVEQNANSRENIVIPKNIENFKENTTLPVKSILIPAPTATVRSVEPVIKNTNNHNIQWDTDPSNDKADFLIEGTSLANPDYSYNVSIELFVCNVVKQSKADIDAQQKFSEFDIEPPWISKKHYWNGIFDSRYESLMRNTKWPPLKVILIPRTHVDTIWKRSFEQYHNETVNKILSNIVKKLQFYSNLTFTWNEISHLSQWWKTTTAKSRATLRKLVKSGRFEITTGGWIEPDEGTTHIFGLVHQLIEGHQWLKDHLNYNPKVAWLTNSVSHSPTMSYILSASDINQIIFTNLHYSWEQYLAEYQYSDFIWVQSWDTNKQTPSTINDALNKIGHERYPNHATLTHYLQFNSAGFKACGPDGVVCNSDYNFAKSNRNLDISTYNVKEKAEALLEQYSKTGTISTHNVIIAPLGGPYNYEIQTEFDYQYNNYQKLAEFINTNKNVYKATIEFGTPKDYFSAVLQKQKDYPTLKGDFLNFADINSGSPAYWTGFYTSRPLTKILLRRVQSTLRSTEILFSFALSLNSFRGYNMTHIFDLLLKSRETVARLLDRNVVSGTVTAYALKYVHKLILKTVKDCWYIQEVSASFISMKPGLTTPYLQKYVYRDGEFISVFRTVSPGDQIYVFNSLSHERTEIVELVTRYPNIRIVDHNRKDITVQINPVWKYSSDNVIMLSRRFFKINFVIVLPPMTLELFKIKETYDGSQNAATIYCLYCKVDDISNDEGTFPFNIQPLQSGDIQLENYKHRLIFDELTGFLKTVVEKETNREKLISIDYGAFRESSINSGMFLFNTNASKPLFDILSPYRLGVKSKLIMIVSGLVVTEMITIYGRLLQHTVKIFNLLNSPLSSGIYIESKVDYEVSPKNRDIELFISIQTDIENGITPKMYTDNNGFQYAARILNISRRIESNIYPMTSMAFIQDKKSRLTLVTDHAQGVTALQEGQLVVILDRRVLFNDGRGTNEGLADSSATCHRHFILLENLAAPRGSDGHLLNDNLVLPSVSAAYLADSLNYLLDIFIVDKNQSDLCYYAFMPLIKTSFPCDVAVLNYRIILKRGALHKYTPSSAFMILHRYSFSCQIDYRAHRHCNGENAFALDKILRNIKSVYQTNLPGTNDGVPVLNFNRVNFPPMELTTLRVHF